MDIKSLVDPEGGLIDRRIFADREIYSWNASVSLRAAGFISATNARFPIPAISSPATWAKIR